MLGSVWFYLVLLGFTWCCLVCLRVAIGFWLAFDLFVLVCWLRRVFCLVFVLLWFTVCLVVVWCLLCLLCSRCLVVLGLVWCCFSLIGFAWF